MRVPFMVVSSTLKNQALASYKNVKGELNCKAEGHGNIIPLLHCMSAYMHMHCVISYFYRHCCTRASVFPCFELKATGIFAEERGYMGARVLFCVCALKSPVKWGGVNDHLLLSISWHQCVVAKKSCSLTLQGYKEIYYSCKAMSIL